MKKLFILMTGLLLISELALSQEQIRTQTASPWRRGTAIILFSGIGGGILGLSTLSFYGDPKEHTNNVTMGALLGLLAGTGYLIYENAPKAQMPARRNDYFGMFGSPEMAEKKPTPYASVPKFEFEFTF